MQEPFDPDPKPQWQPPPKRATLFAGPELQARWAAYIAYYYDFSIQKERLAAMHYIEKRSGFRLANEEELDLFTSGKTFREVVAITRPAGKKVIFERSLDSPIIVKEEVVRPAVRNTESQFYNVNWPVLLGLLFMLFIWFVSVLNQNNHSKTDGVYESATEKMDNGIPLNDREAQRVQDIINYDQNQKAKQIEQKNGEYNP